MIATFERQGPTLCNLVRGIVNEYPDGLRHPEFVRKILESGYVHEEATPISVAVHGTIKNLVTAGVLIRSEDEERGIREYLPARLLASA